MFCSISTKHTKRRKNTEKHWKHTKNSPYTIRSRVYCGRFPRAKSQKSRLYCTKHLLQNICKTHHKTPKKHSQSQNIKKTRFDKLRLRRKHTAKLTQNAQKRHKTLTIPIQTRYVLRAFGVFSQNTLDLSQKHTIRNVRVHYGGAGSRTRRGSRSRILWMFFKNSVLRCLWCFVVFCVPVFSSVFLQNSTKQHKTATKIYKLSEQNV